MTIKVYTHTVKAIWSDAEMQAALAAMPAAHRDRILSYRNIMDRQSRLAGRLLLRKMLKDSAITLELKDVKFTSWHKPYLDTNFSFSISHTDGMVACAGSAAHIGLDVEAVKPINESDYRDILTANEWATLHSTGSQLSFWEIWTRKEAIAKAAGYGIAAELKDLDVIHDAVTLKDTGYYLYKISPGEGLAAHVAVRQSAPLVTPVIQITDVSIHDLLGTA